MAQLTDDCFAFGGRLIPLAEAERLIAERYGCVVGSEMVRLAEGCGRVLAAPVAAGVAVPPSDNAAVDGFAIRLDDLLADRPTLLKLAGREAAGHPTGAALPRGRAARVFTGAVMPPGADTVLMQEDCTLTPEGVVVPTGIARGANRRCAGEDVALGETVLPQGRRLTPADLALLAALGRAEVEVRRPLRAALFSTGDELTEPGSALAAGRIFDANRFMLGAMLRRLGVEVQDGGILPDNESHISGALRDAAATHDVVITSGGVSTGEEDHVRSAIGAFGQVTFWRVAIRPGRPVALGEAFGIPLIGLPGNPVAALVTFVTIARVAIDRLAGALPVHLPRFPVVSALKYRKKPGRREYPRVTLEADGAVLRGRLFPKFGAGIITSLTHADALLELAEDSSGLMPGDVVPAIPLGLLFG
jgi:molybdopterin molybdotransferase